MIVISWPSRYDYQQVRRASAECLAPSFVGNETRVVAATGEAGRRPVVRFRVGAGAIGRHWHVTVERGAAIRGRGEVQVLTLAGGVIAALVPGDPDGA